MRVLISGKGGVGKSVLASLLAKVASREKEVLILDVDESNPGLYAMLGFKGSKGLMESFENRKEAFEKKLFESKFYIANTDLPLVKKGKITLVSIGKIQKALEGCACPMGAVSRNFLENLMLKENEVLFIDAEAGVEHFGRGIVSFVDVVIAIVEPSFESILLAEKINSFAKQVNKACYVVMNKIKSKEELEILLNEISKRNLKSIGAIPYDEKIFFSCLKGERLEKCSAEKEVEKIWRYIKELSLK